MHSQEPLVSIVIPVFNKWDLTRQCLESIHKAGAEGCRVIVVDNASTDETPAACPELGSSLFAGRFSYHRAGENMNFGPACNLGANIGRGRYLFFLNNDTIVTEGWLDPLVREFESTEKLGAVGPLLAYPVTDEVQHLGVSFFFGVAADHYLRYIPMASPLARRRRYFRAITGAALMIPRNLFEQCGGFYPEYRNGYEDLDLCCALRDRGCKMTCAPESLVYHLEGGTPGRGDHEEHNYRVFVRRFGETLTPDFHLLAEADGLKVNVTPSGIIYYTLPQDRAAELDRKHDRETDLVALWDEMILNPLWESGHELLARKLEGLREFDYAISIRTTQNRLFPTMENNRKLLNLGRRAKRPDIVNACLETINDTLTWLATEERISGWLKLAADYFRDQGRKDLADTFENSHRQALSLQNPSTTEERPGA